jgi:4'-phosphopantetheinyl transferase
MLEIYYTKHSDLHSPIFIEKCIQIFPLKIQKKLLRQKNKKNMYNSLLGNLLLIEAFKNKYTKNVLNDVERSEFGRPFLPIPFEFDFNISHSGNYVVCAIGQGPLGIDIEKLKSINIQPLKTFFSAEEWIKLNTSKELETDILKLWTKKEAILKADGRGFQIPWHQVVIETDTIGYLEKEKWFLQEMNISKEYITNVATTYPIKEYKVTNVVFKPI